MAVWQEFEYLSIKHKCLSLGQGAPGYGPPQFLRDFMLEAIDKGQNQYTRTFGHVELV